MQILAERFWAKVAATEGCWWWTASRDRYGYGQISTGPRPAKPMRAHRVAYQLCFGALPDGLVLDHLCGHRTCVNPFHLEPVTHGENTKRGNKGRFGIRYRKRT